MMLNGYLQIGLYLAVLLLLAKPLGIYMARVYEGQDVWLNRMGAPLERLIYRLCGVHPEVEMCWTRYAFSLLLFSFISVPVVYGIQRLQGSLPLNPEHLGAVGPDLAWNTAVSFVTNTNWQAYGGETTLSYFSQMTALAVQNFVSAAAGNSLMLSPP